MDDPISEPKVLFDPQHSLEENLSTLPVSLFQDEPFAPRAPRRPVQIVVVPETGQIILIGDEADVAALLPILEQITKLSKLADTEIRIFNLDHADATSVINYLTQLYSRVNVTGGGLFRQPTGQPLGQASVIMFALPRQNAILVAGPKNQMKNIEETIRKLDMPIAADARVKAYQLEKQSASRIATTLQNLYAQRFIPNEQSPNQNQIRIQAEERSNTILVQAGPTDQDEIARIIEQLDKNASKVMNELRLVQLKSAIANDLAVIIQAAIQDTLGTGVTTPGQQPGLPGQQPGQPGLPGQQPGGLRPGAAAAAKALSLRFVTQKDGKALETGFLEDVRITPDARTNALLVSAPQASMDLLLALIRELDIPPAATAEVKVFTFRNSDATQIGLLLQQIFLGQNQGGGNLNRPGGNLGQLPINIGGVTGELAPLVPIRLAVDTRTNSLIIAGQRSDIILSEALINKLEGTVGISRRNEVIKLRNSTANDVATAINNFLQTELGYLQTSGEVSTTTQAERQVVVVPETISNSLIISATPAAYDILIRLIKQLDELPPQVDIQVLIAEVRLDGTEEFGVELGFQSPFLFERNLTGGVTINEPGFNFNQTALPLPNNSLGANPLTLAPQGLTNFNVGRQGSVGFGGFVFNATSETVNILVRALQSQGKIEVLSRPQITTLDNQTAAIQVGQTVPIISGTSVTNGTVTNQVTPTDVGIILQVTPKINPEVDGHVIMRVQPEVSSVDQTSIPLGNGAVAPIINRTVASTTISAMDGQTVVIGGLIIRRDSKQERKVPWIGDLAYVGALFRFRSQTKSRSELLILLTPRVIRNRGEAFQLMAEETRKMHWNMKDVTEIHGDIGLGYESMLPGGNGYRPRCGSLPGNDCMPVLPGPMPLPDETLPKPKPNPPPPIDPAKPPIMPPPEPMSSPMSGPMPPAPPPIDLGGALPGKPTQPTINNVEFVVPETKPAGLMPKRPGKTPPK